MEYCTSRVVDHILFFLERKVPLTLVYLGTTDWKLPHVPSSDEKESKRSFVRWRVHMCAFVVVQPLIYRAFLVSAWQLNTSPSAKQMAAVLGRGGGPGQNCRDGQTLTAALILLLFLLHTQGFLGFLKYFCLSVLSLLLPPPLFLSLCQQAVIGCYDRTVAGLSASSKAQFNYSFSLTWHAQAQMHAYARTHEGEVAHKHTWWHTNGCTQLRAPPSWQ